MSACTDAVSRGPDIDAPVRLSDMAPALGHHSNHGANKRERERERKNERERERERGNDNSS